MNPSARSFCLCNAAWPGYFFRASIVVLVLLVAGCSGDPRPLQEAVVASEVGLARLSIATGQSSDRDIFINPGESLQFGFEAFGAEDQEITLANDNRRWSVSNPSVASISDSGLFQGLDNGQVAVSLRVGGIFAQAVGITVSDADLASIDTISGPAALVECSRSSDYRAIGTFTDTSERELSNVVWSVAGGDSGVLLSATASSAVVGALSSGSIILQATVDEVSGTRQIEVSTGLLEINIVPDSISLERSASLALLARASYDDGGSGTVSDLVTWSLDDSNSLATLTQSAGETGVLRGVGLGTTTVVATCGDASATAEVSVIEPALIIDVEIEASDNPLILSLSGSGERLRAFARSAAGSFEEVTARASWQIIAGEDVLDIDDAGSNRGEVTPRIRGSARVQVSYRGEEDELRIIVR